MLRMPSAGADISVGRRSAFCTPFSAPVGAASRGEAQGVQVLLCAVVTESILGVGTTAQLWEMQT